MKQSPDAQHLDVVLRSSALVAGGFMGDDARRVAEVIDADAAELFHRGIERTQLADRMKEITREATSALGTWARVGEHLEAMVDEVRGATPCPWPHEAQFPKRVTTVKRTDTGRTIRWSDLNIHMIDAHGFFEGKGSFFRLEPADLIGVLF